VTKEAYDALKKEHDELKKQYTQLDSNFRRLQATITPTQQKNADLNRELAALKTRFEKETGKSPDKPAVPAIREDRLKGLAEVDPEAAALVQEMGQFLTQQADAISNQNEDTIRRKIQQTISSIEDAHPDARHITAESSPFWAWIDSHGPAAPAMIAVLKAPWEYANGADAVMSYFSGYKEFQAQAAPVVPEVPTAPIIPSTPVATAAPVAPQVPSDPAQQGVTLQRPAPTPRPTDTAPTPRGRTQIGNAPVGKPRRWTQQEWTAKQQEMRQTRDTKRIQELKAEIKQQMALR
jgi:hypothetical protein